MRFFFFFCGSQLGVVFHCGLAAYYVTVLGNLPRFDQKYIYGYQNVVNSIFSLIAGLIELGQSIFFCFPLGGFYHWFFPLITCWATCHSNQYNPHTHKHTYIFQISSKLASSYTFSCQPTCWPSLSPKRFLKVIAEMSSFIFQAEGILLVPPLQPTSIMNKPINFPILNI